MIPRASFELRHPEEDMKRLDKYLEELGNLPSRTRAFGLHRRKSVLPTAQQMKSLPLHAKRVPPMDLNFIMKHLLSDSATEAPGALVAFPSL